MLRASVKTRNLIYRESLPDGGRTHRRRACADTAGGRRLGLVQHARLAGAAILIGSSASDEAGGNGSADREKMRSFSESCSAANGWRRTMRVGLYAGATGSRTGFPGHLARLISGAAAEITGHRSHGPVCGSRRLMARAIIAGL